MGGRRPPLLSSSPLSLPLDSVADARRHLIRGARSPTVVLSKAGSCAPPCCRPSSTILPDAGGPRAGEHLRAPDRALFLRPGSSGCRSSGRSSGGAPTSGCRSSGCSSNSGRRPTSPSPACEPRTELPWLLSSRARQIQARGAPLLCLAAARVEAGGLQQARRQLGAPPCAGRDCGSSTTGGRAEGSGDAASLYPLPFRRRRALHQLPMRGLRSTPLLRSGAP
jgi:hypothetical protein